MKKLGMIVVAVLMITSIAQANIYVNWKASGGLYFTADPNTGILGANNSGNSTIAQLIWSSDTVANDSGVGGTATGDDVILQSLVLTADGADAYSGYAWFGTATSGTTDFGASSGGYLYVRMFQDDSIDIGDWFYAGALVAVEDKDTSATPLPTPQTIEMNRGGLNGDAVDDGANGMQVVPEPATMALFGLGLAVLGLRKRK